MLLTFLLPYADRVVLVGEHGTALEVERLGKIGKNIFEATITLYILFCYSSPESYPTPP